MSRIAMERPAAFTLVEIVVVVLILGVLSSVAALKTLRLEESAADKALRHDLTIVRDAIALYSCQNEGALPGADGKEKTFKQDLVPYLRKFPVCRVKEKNDEVLVTGDAGTPQGETDPKRSWKYYYKQGVFIVNYHKPTATDPTMNYDDL